MKKSAKRPPSPVTRRILFLGGSTTISPKPSVAIVSGVVRFLSAHPEAALFIHEMRADGIGASNGLDVDVDGVISCQGANEPAVRSLVTRKRRRPFVFVCAPCESPSLRRRSASLWCDDAAIAASVASLLARHGLTEFGYVGSLLGKEDARWDHVRREAFARLLAERGFAAHIYEPQSSLPGSRAEFAELAAWLRSLPKPCGLFAANDRRAMHVLTICRAEGIAVPEQIQIAGVDDEEWICENTSPTLTSIEPDFEGAGYRAAELLFEMLNGAPGGRTETFGARQTVERMSTTDVHGSMSRAVRARDYIRNHAGEPLSVAMLAKMLGCSLRTLQTSYRAVFKTTVWDDIAETRLENAKRLLERSRAAIGEIPALVGFSSAVYFTRFFRKRTGMSMRDWRRLNNP